MQQKIRIYRADTPVLHEGWSTSRDNSIFQQIAVHLIRKLLSASTDTEEVNYPGKGCIVVIVDPFLSFWVL